MKKIKKKIVILGAGFAGINLALKLDKRIFQIMILDRNNYHQFVKQYDGHRMTLSNGQVIPTRTEVWTAGVTANHIDGLPPESVGWNNRLLVDRIGRVKGVSGVSSVGDIACMQTPQFLNGTRRQPTLL